MLGGGGLECCRTPPSDGLDLALCLRLLWAWLRADQKISDEPQIASQPRGYFSPRDPASGPNYRAQ